MTIENLSSGLIGAIIGAAIACTLTYWFQRKLLEQQLKFQRQLHDELMEFQKKSGDADFALKQRHHDASILKLTNIANMLDNKAERIVHELRRK